jgi:hypothetical protein
MRDKLTDVEYVNIHGQPILVRHSPADKPPAKKTSRRSPDKAQWHKGFRVVGFSPDQLLRGRLEHEQAIAAARANGTEVPRPWSEETYMQTHRPMPVRSKPYELREAAQIVCDMAVKNGWKRCDIVALVHA